MNWQLASYAVSGNNRYLLDLMLERSQGYLTNQWTLLTIYRMVS